MPPEKVIDVQALAGDSVDNVPGVPGIGIKTAAELIGAYGDLDTLLQRAGEIKQPKRREKLIEFAEQARISRQLVTLKDDVPIGIGIEALGVQDPNAEALLGFLRGMEFNTLTKRIAEGLGTEAPPPLAVSVGASLKPEAQGTAEKIEALEASASADATPAAAVAAGAAKARAQAIDRSRYETVTTRARLEDWVARGRAAGRVAFDTETSRLSATEADLVGFSLAIVPGEACYVPIGHAAAGGDLFGEETRPPQLSPAEAMDIVRPLLEDPSVLKIGQNMKYDALSCGATASRWRRSTIRCCSPMRSMRGAVSTAWIHFPSAISAIRASRSRR